MQVVTIALGQIPPTVRVPLAYTCQSVTGRLSLGMRSGSGQWDRLLACAKLALTTSGPLSLASQIMLRGEEVA